MASFAPLFRPLFRINRKEQRSTFRPYRMKFISVQSKGYRLGIVLEKAKSDHEVPEIKIKSKMLQRGRQIGCS